jgi:two-component system CheB/CheR fusion protein
VGIGASAGGLEAFTHLLEALPADTGMAFVLISHLSHTHKSMLTEVLSKSTRMKVTEVSRKTRVQANHVYVITPDADLALSDGAITVRSAVGSRKPHMVIDHFFRSLAQHRKNQAIGVVLSGTGTDGTLGLAAIQAEGGITFAQDDKSAKFPDMPRSASAGIGAADFVLSPDGIAREIAQLARHPYLARKHRPAGGAEVFTEPLEVRHQIFRVVRAATGVDFSEYKPATIDRRISRRMVVHRIDSRRGAPRRARAGTAC